jgi:hypothetical protein
VHQHPIMAPRGLMSMVLGLLALTATVSASSAPLLAWTTESERMLLGQAQSASYDVRGQCKSILTHAQCCCMNNHCLLPVCRLLGW